MLQKPRRRLKANSLVSIEKNIIIIGREKMPYNYKKLLL